MLIISPKKKINAHKLFIFSFSSHLMRLSYCIEFFIQSLSNLVNETLIEVPRVLGHNSLLNCRICKHTQ